MNQNLPVWKIALGVFIGTLAALIAAALLNHAAAWISAPPPINADLERQMMLDALPATNAQ